MSHTCTGSPRYSICTTGAGCGAPPLPPLLAELLLPPLAAGGADEGSAAAATCRRCPLLEVCR